MRPTLTRISSVVPTATLLPTLTPAPAFAFAPTRVAYKPGSPLPVRSSPRTLLDANDITRMKQWIEKYAWARDVRDQIVKNADAYPARYLASFNLKSPDLPPGGGQWSLWYICPDGLRMQYQPAHTPPHYCPSDGRYYASPSFDPRSTLFDEVIYQNRHHTLAGSVRDLGLAYALTGEKKYADSAASILRAYAKAYPGYPQHDKDGKNTRTGGKATAQTLDEASWLIDLTFGYDLIADTLSQTDQTRIADNVLRPAAAIIQGHRAKLSNWQTWHNAAIAIVGFALNDEKLVNDAYADRENGFFTQLEIGAAQDGFWWEGSWSYHFFTLQPMLYLAEMGARVGMEPYAQPNLRALLTAPVTMALPNLALPRFNDDAGTTLNSGHSWLYEIGYNRYHDGAMFTLLRNPRPWQALLWGSETLPAATAVAPLASELLPKAGYAVFRMGIPNDASYLAFKFGPHGGGHGHYDKLNYVTFSLSKAMAADPGTHSYAAASHNSWDKATIAHNTIVVDEKNQAEATGNLHRYAGFSDFGFVTADAGSVYPNRAAITRTLVFTGDYWLDLTRATALDGKPHRFDWIYHNPGTITTTLSLAPYAALPANSGYNYLADEKASAANNDWQATWDVSGVGQPYGSVYRGREGISATFTLTRTRDNFAGQLDYDFAAVADGYAVYQTQNLNLPNELPTRIEAQVFGDASNDRFTLRIIDATGEKFAKDFGAIHWTGWQTVTLNLDKTWAHYNGNDDGVMDLPVSQVALQISRAAKGARSGKLLADDLALTFPKTGRIVVEDFEGARARVELKMRGASDTTVVIGNGIDQTNQPIPFAMARRNAKETTFSALFEPHRVAPRIAKFEAVDMGWQIIAPGVFTDTLVLTDEDGHESKLFGAFGTDAVAAYVRQDAANHLHVLAVANARYLSDAARPLLTASSPITAQVTYQGQALTIMTQDPSAGQLRVYAPMATQAIVDEKPAAIKRDGEYVIVEVR